MCVLESGCRLIDEMTYAYTDAIPLRRPPDLQSDAPEGAGIYQRRPIVTQRAIRNAVSRTRATTHRVPICLMFMCCLVVPCGG